AHPGRATSGDGASTPAWVWRRATPRLLPFSGPLPSARSSLAGRRARGMCGLAVTGSLGVRERAVGEIKDEGATQGLAHVHVCLLFEVHEVERRTPPPARRDGLGDGAQLHGVVELLEFPGHDQPTRGGIDGDDLTIAHSVPVV